MPVEIKDFTAISALYLPEMAQYNWLVNLPENVASLGLTNVSGQTMGSFGELQPKLSVFEKELEK